MTKITLGTRYYNWADDNSINEVKVIKLLGENKCRCKYTVGPKTGDIIDLNNSDILDNYTMLTPDGYITFNIATMGGTDLRDVIVFITKNSDLLNGDTVPYCVCRQSVNDLFTFTAGEQKQYFGISVSKDSCPADVEFTNYLACNGVEEYVAVSIYIGDKLDEILSLFKHKDFDNVLYNLFDSRCKYVSSNIKYIANKNMQKRYLDGYCKTLNDLLKINNFEYDFYRAFNIIPIKESLKDNNNEECPTSVVDFLRVVLRRDIDKSIVIPYDKSIDLSKIERKYTLVADINRDVYIIAYTDRGVYQISQGNTLDVDNIQKLLNSTTCQWDIEKYTM